MKRFANVVQDILVSRGWTLSFWLFVLALGHAVWALDKTEYTLPDSVVFRTRQESFNRKYFFALRNDTVWFKSRHNPRASWLPLSLHKKLHKPMEISSDDEYVVVLDSAGSIFTMKKGLADGPNHFTWTQKWGAPFWTGKGMDVPHSKTAWDISFFSPAEDSYYQAFNGNKHDVGQGCTNLFFLSHKGQRLTYLDPWLPNDLSYEVATPHRGRFRAANMSASGSTIFLINRYGDMYTRLFDFDLVGSDELFFRYSYDATKYTVQDNSKLLRRKVPRPLPFPGWKRQPKIDGIITDRITIFKIGKGGLRRTLRVEGKNSQGHSGYFTKDINEPCWTFVRTNDPLQGTVIENAPEDKSLHTLGSPEWYTFEARTKGLVWQIKDFHPYDTPTQMRVAVSSVDTLDLNLHGVETIRQLKMPRGLCDTYRTYTGAIEVLPELTARYENLGEEARLFLDTYFAKKRFVLVRFKTNRTKLKMLKPRRFKMTFELKSSSVHRSQNPQKPNIDDQI